jgi:ribosomal protein S18 acetylase RimI-like enzyme
VASLFADYEPDAPGNASKVDVVPLSRVNLGECVALAVQREGGDEARWKTSLEGSLDADDRATFVALLDGQVAGYGTAGWFTPSRTDPATAIPDGWYLLGLVVGPQSRRQGVGRQLTAARLRWLGTRGRRVSYFVSSANRASIALHTTLGFQLIANDIKVPGITFTRSGQLYAALLP